ncbi:hypothetical protein CsSME_00022919 [Camellia sinensis var. sinensis]
MVRIIPMASSIRPSLSSLRFSPFCTITSSRFAVSISSCNPSRRLNFFHLGSAVPQSQFFSLKASKLLRAEGNKMAVRSTGNMAQASTSITQEDALEWVKKDKRRMLHVVYRVGDLDRTIKFYTECLGMKLLRKRDIPEERYTNAFLGYGPEDSHFVIELTYSKPAENSLICLQFSIIWNFYEPSLTIMILELVLVILVLQLKMLPKQ